MALPKGNVKTKSVKPETVVEETIEPTAVEAPVAEEVSQEAEDEQVCEEEEEDIPFDADEEFDAEVEDFDSEVEESPESAKTRTTTVVASVAPSQPPAAGSQGQVVKDLESAGFAGITTGFGTFPQISLQNEGHFESSEGWDLGSGFTCLIMGSREKFIVKNTKCEKRDEDFVYTYDKVTDANTGEPIQATLGHWAKEGWGYEIKPYLEIPAQLVEGDHDGEYVLLSIPKTSIGRFSSYAIRLRLKGQLPSDVVTCVYRGDKVEKVDYPFYPWSFKEQV